MKLKIKEGTTSKIVRVFAQDSSATDGSGLTGLTESDPTAHYIAEGDSSVTDIALASATVGTYTSGGFVEVDSTKMPGVYEFGIPDAAIDDSSDGSVVIMIKGATNMAPILIEIELDKVDYRSTSWANLMLSTGVIITGQAQTGTLSTTEMTTDLTEATDDHYNGCVLIFTSGNMIGQRLSVTDYTGTGGKLTFSAATEIPANGDSFILV